MIVFEDQLARVIEVLPTPVINEISKPIFLLCLNTLLLYQ